MYESIKRQLHKSAIENKNDRFTIVAAVVKNRKILHYAVNNYSGCCYTSRIAGHIYDHAETKLLNSLPRNEDSKVQIFTYGLSPNGYLLENTKPCSKCMKVLKERGYNKIVSLQKHELKNVSN